MADAIVTFGVEKLWELVSEEYKRLEGVGEQITELKSDMTMLMSFLSDAAGVKNQTSALARNCLEEIKEITYEAEDTIETFLLKEEHRNGSGMKNRMKSLVCIQGSRRKTAIDITSISKRISKVINVMQTLGIKSDIMNGGSSQALLDMKREKRRQTLSSEPESNLVGLEKNVEELVGLLVGNDCSHGVSITGLGGLGKTTLARQVFHHRMVNHHFVGGLAWVSVSQDFTPKDVWQTILRDLSPRDYVADMKERELLYKLSQLLQEKKVLIVFDDVWEKEDWERIKRMFPERKGKACWKVILTSRKDGIHPQCITFKPDLLNGDECWKLLHMIAFPKKDTTGNKIVDKPDKEMERMAEEMVTHCGRLPLAVKVLGGLLATQHTLHQWKMISENIKSHIVSFNDDSGSVDSVLSLSFEGLPSYLKHCLLHLASYPEDHRISLEDVSYIWAAEGITKPRHYEGATIRDVSDFYIEELVERNLVISERDMGTSRFEFCQLHDLMREVCLLKAKEEKFFKIVTHPACSSSVHSQTSNQSRKLVVHTYNRDGDSGEQYTRFNGEREIKNSKLRSLLFIPVDGVVMFTMGSNFMELQLLRVLDLRGAVFKGRKLPSSIGKLIHLKYLSLNDAGFHHLPSSIGNLKSLLYLNMGDYIFFHVPNVLKEMQELRYLHLKSFIDMNQKLELGGLVKLETLINFSTKNSSVTDLHCMTRLRSLSINIEGCNVDIDMLASTLSKLRDLENLTMWNVGEIVEERSVLDCVHLTKPKLMRTYISRLPDVQHFPVHLTTINLHLYYLEEDPMPILEKLLQLKEVKLRHHRVKKMVCSDGGFPKLKKLEFYRLDGWEEWIVEEDSMPLLDTLEIKFCEKLKELPDEVRFLYTLRKLTIPNIWKERLSVGGAYYYKIQRIRFVYYFG